MNRIARAVTVTGIAMGAAVLAAPSAMADIHIYAVDKANIGHYGPTHVGESGPGNLNFSSVTGSPYASPKVGNESIKVDDINTSLKGGKGNSVANEVEGSEQDSGEGAESAESSETASAAEQGETAQPAEQGEAAEAAEQGKAEQASAEGVQQNTLEAQQQAPQQQEAAPQQEAAQQEAAQQQEAAPQQEAAQQEAAQPQAAQQQEAAPQQEAAQQEAAQPQAAQQQEAAPQQEAAQQEAAPQQEAPEQSNQRVANGKNGHDGKVKFAQWVKHSNIGHNGPTLVGESGPGNLNFSSVTGSPYASPKVGNESTKVDDINTSLKGGKGNTVANEVEGSEQDEAEGATAAQMGAQ